MTSTGQSTSHRSRERSTPVYHLSPCFFIRPSAMQGTNSDVPYSRFFTHSLLTGMLLARGFYLGFAFSLPLMLFHFRRMQQNRHLLDNTRIFSQVATERRNAMAKLGFYLGLFAYIIVW
mmetsp:Transcript_2797/g.5159  ORF Transcript_2797/g.5159 Transcript_2797/m.5159 type:complete len:119 (+) Transcript_2797:146-502(+)